MKINIFIIATCLLGAVLAVSPAWATSAAPKTKPAAEKSKAEVKEVKAGPVRMIGDLQTITTKYEDTLVHLARRYNVGFVEIRAANPGVDPWLPGSGTRVTIPNQHIIPNAPRDGIVINLPEMRLYYFTSPDEPPATYPIGIGRSGLLTPVGTTTVTRRTVDPLWTPTERMRQEDPELPAVVKPGPENPMGTHALYLGWPTYAIHGTDKPYSIGRRQSAGCIRMYPEDILTLYDNVAVGTRVTVVDQPVKTAWVDDDYYIQVHPTQDQSDLLSTNSVDRPEFPLRDKDIQTIIKGAGDHVDKLDWAKVRTAVRERRGVPMMVANKNRTPSRQSQEARDDVLPDKDKKGRAKDKTQDR
jgi:L,D-transpeptidase ErfK/SrfK